MAILFLSIAVLCPKGEWFTDYAQAAEKAKSTGRVLMIYAYRAECGFCQSMEKETFPNSTISDYLDANFVCLKIHRDTVQGPAAKHLSQVPGNFVPVCAFLTSDGQFAGYAHGYQEVQEFRGSLESALKDARSIPPLEKTGSASPKAAGGTEKAPERINAPRVGAVARSYSKIVDPWEGKEPGSWYRFKVTAGDDVHFEDVGLKARQEGSNLLSRQSGTAPGQEMTDPHRKVRIIGEETLQISNRTFPCEIRSIEGANDAPDAAVREWVIKGGRYAGAVLKVVSPKETVLPTKVWDHTLKVKGREFDCLVVESDSKVGAETTSLKTWNCQGLPRPIREEREGWSILLVDLGEDWSRRPVMPASGR